MRLMEQPIVDFMVTSPSSSDVNYALRSTLLRLMKLDHPGWMHRLAEDGFTHNDIEQLEAFISTSFNPTHLEERLGRLLEETVDLNDNSKLNSTIDNWLTEIQWANIWRLAGQADFPDQIDVVAYTGSHIARVASSTFAFESLRREQSGSPEPDWVVSEVDIQAGIELAEAGLAEDIAEWPTY